MNTRREFITLIGGAAAAWPLAASAQAVKLPLVGLLNGVSNESYADRIAAIREGLQEAGFVEGQNVLIEYRSAEGQYDRLPALAADLVRHSVAVIVAIGGSSAPRAAKAATSTIPIVFAIGNDPVEAGLVQSLNRPNGNATGINLNNAALAPKRLELVRELVPGAALIGALLNPSSPNFEIDLRNLPAAADKFGRELVVLKAGSEPEIDAAFAAMRQRHVAVLVVENDAYFNSRRNQIVGLAARYALPTIYGLREAVRAGGLISYAPKFEIMYRQTGIYAGRVLKGERPADLPVMQPTRFELVINLETAKALGLNVPQTLLATADEVIE